MKKVTLILALFLGFIPILNAQWTSPGNGTTYTLPDLVETGCVLHDYANAVFSISTDITISATDRLYITRDNAPFCLLFNENDLTLTIKGALVVEGDEDFHYYIGMQVYAQHGRIRFEDASEPSRISNCDFADLSGIQIIGSDVTFENCIIFNFNTFHQSSTVNCLNCSPVFTRCEFYSNEGAAISSPANGQASPQIVNCQFTNNVTSNANQPQINLGPGAQDSIRIVNCTIEGEGHDMSGGIAVTDLMNTGDTKILLKDNDINHNRYGYNQQGYHLSSTIIGNTFDQNNLETNPMNGGSGISIYGIDENNKAYIRNNVITKNLWGITVINAADVDLGTEDDWGNNIIHDNGHITNYGMDFTYFDLYNNSANDIMAVGNYWGTTDIQEIEEHITHQNDDPSLGLVTFVPFLENDNVSESNTTDFEVWPNPVSDGSFTLTLENTMPSELVIYNVNGQMVKTQRIDNSVNTIRIDTMESGIYFVELKNDNGTKVKKLIVK